MPHGVVSGIIKYPISKQLDIPCHNIPIHFSYKEASRQRRNIKEELYYCVHDDEEDDIPIISLL